MTTKKLKEILEKHQKWLKNEDGGEWANLRDADLAGANLNGADLRSANLNGANLRDADLAGADLRWADLRSADLRWADLAGANLNGADLRSANLNRADLRDADLAGADLGGVILRLANLNGANLSKVNLAGADLSGAKELLSAVNFMEAHFERTDEGYIAYKTFNSPYKAPEHWEIKCGSVITENVLFDRCCDCGSGINVAPLEWVKKNYKSLFYYHGDIWKVLIRWEWLCGVCVPYNSDGKIRCEKVELIEIVK